LPGSSLRNEMADPSSICLVPRIETSMVAKAGGVISEQVLHVATISSKAP
jgi:hypothetical protein